jgi:hypothetical protein
MTLRSRRSYERRLAGPNVCLPMDDEWMTRRGWAIVGWVAAARRAVAQAVFGSVVTGRVNNTFSCGVFYGSAVQGRDISLGSPAARPAGPSLAAGDVSNMISGDVVNGTTVQGRDVSGPSLGPVASPSEAAMTESRSGRVLDNGTDHR